jgi:hypothetical protein
MVTPVLDRLVPPVLDTIEPVLGSTAPVLATVDQTVAPVHETVARLLGDETAAALAPAVERADGLLGTGPAAALRQSVPADHAVSVVTLSLAPSAAASSGGGSTAGLAQHLALLDFAGAALRADAPTSGAASARSDADPPQAAARAPSAPLGALGSGISGSFSPPSTALFLALLALLFCMPCLLYGKFVLAPARWRPVLFVSLLERPG